MSNDITKVPNVMVAPLVYDNSEGQKIKSELNLVAEEEKDKLTEGKKEKGVTGSNVTSLDDVRELVDQGNKMLENIQRNLEFSVDESTKKVVMSIIDKDTGETIRQVPSEDILAIARRMQESDGKSGSIEGYSA